MAKIRTLVHTLESRCCKSTTGVKKISGNIFPQSLSYYIQARQYIHYIQFSGISSFVLKNPDFWVVKKGLPWPFSLALAQNIKISPIYDEAHTVEQYSTFQ